MIECSSEFQRVAPDEPMSTIDRLVTENEHLRRKLQTLPVIEQAKGILMGRHRIPADDAFEMLRRWSQDTNTKLHLVAQTIINHQCDAESPDELSRRVAVCGVASNQERPSSSRVSVSPLDRGALGNHPTAQECCGKAPASEAAGG